MAIKDSTQKTTSVELFKLRLTKLAVASSHGTDDEQLEGFVLTLSLLLTRQIRDGHV